MKRKGAETAEQARNGRRGASDVVWTVVPRSHLRLAMIVPFVLVAILCAWATAERIRGQAAMAALGSADQRIDRLDATLTQCRVDLSAARARLRRRKPVLPEDWWQDLPTDPERVCTIRTAEDARAIRRRLRAYVCGSDTGPVLLEQQTPDRWRVAQAYGIDSIVHVHEPLHPHGGALIWHHGHAQGPGAADHVIDAALAAGWRVAEMCMPLMGDNPRPIVDIPRVGRMQLVAHGQLAFLQPPEGSPIRYFTAPVDAVVTRLVDDGATHVVMAGISGGGWTTTICAALDERIERSYPVAGTWPLYLCEPPAPLRTHWGDWEQVDVGLVHACNILEMHVLGAWGAGRRQVQVLNRHDNQCHMGTAGRSYAPTVAARVAALGAGEWEFRLDEAARRHEVSAETLAWMLAEMDAVVSGQ